MTVKNIIGLSTQKKKKGKNMQITICDMLPFILDIINYFPPEYFKPFDKTFNMGITHFIKIKNNDDQLIFMVGIW